MAETESTADYWADEAATFGDRLAAAREAAGMSAEALARRLGVMPRTIEAWEADRAEPRANKLQIVAGLLNVSLRWLLTGQGEGLEAPAELDEDIAGALADLRGLRGEAARLAESIGRMEKRLRASLRTA